MKEYVTVSIEIISLDMRCDVITESNPYDNNYGDIDDWGV
jgi:hypothetical protein